MTSSSSLRNGREKCPCCSAALVLYNPSTASYICGNDACGVPSAVAENPPRMFTEDEVRAIVNLALSEHEKRHHASPVLGVVGPGMVYGDNTATS